MKRYNITTAYFGPVVEIAELLEYLTSLTLVVVSKRQLSAEILDFCNVRKVPLLTPTKSADLDIPANQFDLGFSYGGDIILKRPHIDMFASGIVNLHAGKLPTYRGRHPIGWAIMENQREITITSHLINEEIDRGEIVHEECLPISTAESERDILNKVQQRVCEVILPTLLDIYPDFETKQVLKGRYLPSFKGQFDTIDPKVLTATEVFNIFRIKRDYGGVMVAGQRFSRCHFVQPDVLDDGANWKIFTCKDGVKVGLK